MADDLFPHGPMPELFPGQIDRTQARYRPSFFDQLPGFAPMSFYGRNPTKAVAVSPPPVPVEVVTWCPRCGGQEQLVPPMLRQCKLCHNLRNG